MVSGKILVAGASGLIGSNLLRRLRDDGRDAKGTYFANAPQPETGLTFEQHDFTKFDDCLAAVKDCETVILCANSVAGAQAMRANPTATLRPNLAITAGLLEAASRSKVQRVVLISSSTVYQEAERALKESDLDLNVQPYPLYRGVAWFHRYTEQLALFYHQLERFAVGIVRPTAVFGPFDHFEDGRSQIIPANIKRALAKENPYVVWGDGTPVRDFLFVEDFVNDLMQLMDGGCTGAVLNCANGTTMTIGEAVRDILAACEHDAEVRYDPSKPSAIPYRALSMERWTEVFGEPRRTPFVEAVRRTVDWYRDQA